MLGIGNYCKNLARRSFHLLGMDVRRIRMHEKQRLNWLQAYNIHTVFDIGANRGDFALEISRTLPDIEIYAFEPLPDLYLRLTEKKNRMKNFTPFNFALGEFIGKARIKRSIFSQSSSLLEMGRLHREAFPFTSKIWEEEISVRPLDEVVMQERLRLREKILIKLDVQGYEGHVIKGGAGIFKLAEVVFCEVNFQELYVGQVSFDELCSLFKEFGLIFRGMFEPYFHPDTGLPLFADAIFIKE